MKKLLAVATALTVAAPAAMASKARVEALGNSRQLVDVQYVFERPYMLHEVGDQVTLEWGSNKVTDTATPAVTGDRHAEGGFIKTHNEMVFGLYLGKQGLLAGTELAEQNPLNLLFGMKTGEIAWGVNLGYSNGKKDATTAAPTDELKSSSMTLDLGARMGDWSVNVGSTLNAKAEKVTAPATETEIKNAMNVGVDYQINEGSVAYVTYSSYKEDKTATPSTSLETNRTEVGYINTFAKTDDVNFFYGVGYFTGKTDDQDISGLPVWMGLEANATSWMVFRASVKQNVFVNNEDVGGKNTDLDSIAFNAGLGLKLGKGMLDATFGTANAGHLSYTDGTTPGENFMSHVSYTYMF